MREKAANGQVIIVFTEHPVLGTLLTPYFAEKLEDGTLLLVEQAFHASPEAMEQMNEAEKQAIDIASRYTEKYLMGIYSREKTVSRFLHKLSEDPDRLKNIVRPFIEKKLHEMLVLIRSGQLPLYQKQAGSKILYAHHAYRVHPLDTEIRFSFHADSRIFSYQLQCYYDGTPFSLSEQKPAIVLTSSPATLLLGMNLYFFPHIESMRLVPFTKKNTISADASQLDKYINNIVIPIARYHEIEMDGFDIVEEKREMKATLSLESTVYDAQVLQLSFRYGDELLAPQTTSHAKRIIYRDDAGQILFFRRDTAAEEKAIRRLLEEGLQRTNDMHFKLSRQTSEKTIIEWICNHREMFESDFLLTGNMGNTPYYMGDIRIEQSYETHEVDWFDLHITVIIGDLRIPFSRFRKHILEERRDFLLPDGRMLLLPEEWFSKYTNLLEKGEQTEKGIRLRRMFLGAVQAALDDNGGQKLPAFTEIKKISVPQGLKAKLRPYQQKGFSWMVHLRNQAFGGCLADDMGLGKTLQTLTILQYVYKSGKPADNTRMADTSPSVAIEKEQIIESDGQMALFSFTSDEDLLPDAHDIREQAPPQTTPAEVKKRAVRKPATLIVVPTSLLHNWKREAKRFTTLSMAEYTSTTNINKKYPERFFGRYNLIFTTYGMMRNNIDILRTYCFEYIVLDESQNIKNSDSLTFRSAIQLQSNYRLVLTGTPIENSLKDLWAQFRFLQPGLLGYETDFLKQFIHPIRQGNVRAERRLRQLIAPFILRRSKNEVAPELPPLTEETIYCEMTAEQSSYYEQEKNSLRNILLQHPHSAERLPSLSVLNGILRLRQLACHPQLIYPDFNGSSGKAIQIVEIFNTLQSEGHKVLIFSSFVKHLEVLAEAFRQRGWKYALLTGETTNRPSEIAHFTEQKDVQAFLISLKAGGVGLNLTQADYVFIIDPWWNPAAEAQAIARAHRIGQDKQVIAYRFITQNSIEEKILYLQEEKRKLAETFITDSEGAPALSAEQWMELLK